MFRFLKYFDRNLLDRKIVIFYFPLSRISQNSNKILQTMHMFKSESSAKTLGQHLLWCVFYRTDELDLNELCRSVSMSQNKLYMI